MGKLDTKGFVGHRTRDSFDGAFFSRSWKKRDASHPAGAGRARVVLAQKADPWSLWQHNIPRVQTVTRDGVQGNEVWGGSVNCFETEQVLKKQYKRDDDGRRLVPPAVCPVCKLLEWVRSEVNSGRLGIVDSVFEWVGDDETKSKVITAGGMYNAFKQDLTPNEKAMMRKKGISASSAWNQNFQAKCNYVFTLADFDDVEAGLQIAIETSLLGDKMKEAIDTRQQQEGEEAGDPWLNPVVFQWSYHEKAKKIDDKYGAIPLPRLDIPEELAELLASEPPSIVNITKLGGVAKLRADLESHCLIDGVPWDELFETAEEEYGNGSEAVEDEPKSKSAKKPAKKLEELPEELVDAEEGDDEEEEAAPSEAIECDNCDAAMGVDLSKCDECGAVYAEDGSFTVPPRPAPPKRKRSDVAKAEAEKKATAKPKKAEPPPDSAPVKKPPGKKTTAKRAAEKMTAASKAAAEVFEDGDDLPAWAKDES